MLRHERWPISSHLMSVTYHCMREYVFSPSHVRLPVHACIYTWMLDTRSLWVRERLSPIMRNSVCLPCTHARQGMHI